MQIAQSFYENFGTGMCSDRNLSDLEHVDDVVLLSEEPIDLQVFSDRLNDSVRRFEMRFTPSKCEMPLQD